MTKAKPAGSTPEQVRAEVERLQAADREREARAEARMAELRKDARKHHEEKAEREHQQKAESARRLEAGRQAAEERDKRAMFNSWVAQGGAPSAFEAAWPDLRAQMLKQRTLEGENAAREGQRATAFLEMNDPSSRSRDHLRASAAPRTRS